MSLDLFLFQVEGRRKTAKAKVKVTKPGTGKLTIKHRDFPHIISDITYFFGLKERHVLLYPLQVELNRGQKVTRSKKVFPWFR